ncbi:unnamed protein product [Eruca vesicaria subsp. sativa]|uniref:Uncharacterized protein n=1 Tax=Eruca vesicaria subsp. sativa TaxID=29727 RepID=A0ABC8J7I6_ERUVS|nr:unnamed protein product [Eruca vesicaria subsp. sativa]
MMGSRKYSTGRWASLIRGQSLVESPQQQGGYHHPQTLEEVRTLWIGDLQYWVDESYLTSCFSQTGELTFFIFFLSFSACSSDFLVYVKVIRNKITGQPEGSRENASDVQWDIDASVRGAKVVTDPNENERNKAMSEMNGLYCSARPMRISVATPRKNVGVQQQYVAKAAYHVPVPVPSVVAAPAYVAQSAQVQENDITGTTVSLISF